jgi:hypothetical protein
MGKDSLSQPPQQSEERQEQIALVSRLTTIISSSLDIKDISEGFAAELRKSMDADWATIALIEGGKLHFYALSSQIGSAWELGDTLPLERTATAYVAATKKALVEADLACERKFWTGEFHLRQRLRSIVYLPLIARGKVLGSLIIGSCRPHAYGERELCLLQHIAAQITTPLLNAKLHKEIEESKKRERRLYAFISWVGKIICTNSDIDETRKQFAQGIRKLMAEGDQLQEDGPPFTNCELKLDPSTYKVQLDDETVKLTPIEFSVLYVLVHNQGRVVPHRELMKQIWGDYHSEDTDYLRAYIRRLRKKLGDCPPRMILTEHGVGYKFVSCG